MAVGLTISKAELDQRIGDISRRLQGTFIDIGVIQGFLSGQDDAAMAALGYTTDEITLIRNAFNDLIQLSLIWTGTDDLDAPKDFRVYVGQLWGIGAT